MPDLASLEIRVRLQDANRLEVACQYTKPDSQEVQVYEDQGGQFDPVKLIALRDDIAGYGRALSQMLFAEPKVSSFCEKALQEAVTSAQPVRLCIAITASATALHGLHWEKLLHPTSDVALARADYVVFSRLTAQSDWRTTGPRRRDSLNALICIADEIRSPDDTPPPFAPFGGAAFAAAANEYLRRANTRTIGGRQDATVANFREALAAGVDVLYAVCHGSINRLGEPTLVLHSETGTADYLTGAELTQMFRELRVVPRLVILVSCGSAGTADDVRMNAIHIAPRLAEAGVACVIGFNGDVEMKTAQNFCRKLFDVLRTDSDIEKAVAEARKAMDADSWWTPVLLSRLRAGALWYRQGFGGFSRSGRLISQDFAGIATSVVDGKVTPIVGPDVASVPLLGSRRELALKWALANGYPLVPGGNDSLPQIAQYLSIMDKRTLPISKAVRYAYEQLCRIGATTDVIKSPSLDQIVVEVDKIISADLAAKWRDPQQLEPYREIANINSKIFITLDWTDQLFHALTYCGKKPNVIVPWYWRDSTKRAGESAARLSTLSTLRKQANLRPTEQEPILFYMFGRLSEDARSLAMSEDDYFDALIELAHDENMFPASVKSALCNSNLMFIGCNLQEWNFRVMLRLLVTRAGFSPRNTDYRHVAANIGPEDSDLNDPERARVYLERYLTNSRIDLYSGTATDFLSDLKNQLANNPANAA